MKTLTTSLILAAACSGACSSIPERPGSDNQGSGDYAASRNQACLLEAQQAFTSGKFSEVPKALSRWQGFMDDPRPLALLGRAAAAEGRYPLAAGFFVRAGELAPASNAIALWTAQAFEATGAWTEAAKSYAKATALDPENVQAVLGSMRAETASGNAAAALAIALKEWKSFNDEAEFVAMSADLAFANHEFALAIEWSLAAGKLGVENEGRTERLILAYAWTGKHAEAVAEAARCDAEILAPAGSPGQARR